MYVNRLILHGVRSLRQTLPTATAGFPPAARRKLLVRGINGSGKSTALESIAELWAQFGVWIDSGTGVDETRFAVAPIRRSFLAKADLAAIELRDVPVGGQSDRPLWIGVGRRDEWDELKRAHPAAEFAGAVREVGWTVELPRQPWREARQASLVGRNPFPNVVYLPPDNRTIRTRPNVRGPARVADVTQFNWLARPAGGVRFQDVVLTLKAVRPDDYAEFRDLVDQFLAPTRKRLLGFVDRGYLMVGGQGRDGRGFEHPVEALSSGERQMLLLIGFVIAFLRPGGIVVIDEPDLHIHAVMTTQLIQTLDYVVRRRSGQLIVASHSETVWDYFSRSTERVELLPAVGGV